jgi:hypothetical protein
MIAAARRDLDEADAGREFTPCDGYRGLSEVWIADPRDGNAHAALLEALAMFVADGTW